MFFYHLRIATKSLRRNPVLTGLLIGAIALGICVSTTFIAVRHLFEKDPLPGKSGNIFYVRIDNWDPQRAYVAEDPNSLPTQITYRDGTALIQSKIPARQTLSYKTTDFVFPENAPGRPFRQDIRLARNDFFTMFDLPFAYGGPWGDAVDQTPEPVVVLDEPTNQKLFAGKNSVGRTVRIGQTSYKVVGVLAHWRPAVKFYDMTQSPLNALEGIFMPFAIGVSQQFTSTGNSDGWASCCNSIQEFLASETVWLQLWVELPTPESRAAYKDFLDNYVREQKKLGRFQRPLHTEITSLTDLMKELGAVPQALKSMSIVSVLFLVVCSLNLVGLLLGKFLSRIPEISVRRALGASKIQVFLQHVVECELVGVVGGAIGLGLSVLTLKLIAKALPNGSDYIRLEPEMIVVSLFLSLVAGLLAGIYPSWRVCSVAPAMQLKLQ